MVDLGGVGVWVIILKYNQYFFLKNEIEGFFFEISWICPISLNISLILVTPMLIDLAWYK